MRNIEHHVPAKMIKCVYSGCKCINDANFQHRTLTQSKFRYIRQILYKSEVRLFGRLFELTELSSKSLSEVKTIEGT